MIVDTGPEPSRGRTHIDVHGWAGWERNCHVAVSIDPNRFIELLINRLSTLD